MNDNLTEVLEKADPPLNEVQKQDQFALASIEFNKFASTLEIQNDDDYRNVAQHSIDAARQIKNVKAFMDPHIKLANDAHKSLTKKKSAIIAPLEDAKKYLGNLLSRWDDVIQAKKQKDIDDLAAAERAKEEKSRVAEKERRDKEAKAHEDAGDKEAAKYIRSAPMPVVTHTKPISTIQTPKVANISYTTRYVVEVHVKELVPEQYKTINQGLLDKTANNFKGDLKIPGCTIKTVKGTNTRTA